MINNNHRILLNDLSAILSAYDGNEIEFTIEETVEDIVKRLILEKLESYFVKEG